eukprot:1141469-Pelagomonas_calceolata.AAC.12
MKWIEKTQWMVRYSAISLEESPAQGAPKRVELWAVLGRSEARRVIWGPLTAARAAASAAAQATKAPCPPPLGCAALPCCLNAQSGPPSYCLDYSRPPPPHCRARWYWRAKGAASRTPCCPGTARPRPGPSLPAAHAARWCARCCPGCCWVRALLRVPHGAYL